MERIQNIISAFLIDFEGLQGKKLVLKKKLYTPSFITICFSLILSHVPYNTE